MMKRCLVILVVGSLGLIACEGQIGDNAGESARHGGEVSALACRAIDPDNTPVRLLSRAEYNNTVADLIGDRTSPLSLSPSAGGIGLDNDALGLRLSPQMLDHYGEVATGIAQRALGRMSSIVGCDPQRVGEEACARSFIESFGKRAFRRPLDADEKEAYFSVFTEGRMDGGFAAGIQLVLEVTLQAPDFLYHVERGRPVDGNAGVAALDDYEIASRLSYFLWNTMPDAELFEAADNGALRTPEQIEEQANRMLGDARARAAARRFHTSWLKLDKLDDIARDRERFPEFSDALAGDMKRETLDYLDDVLFNGGDVASIFVSPTTFVNGRLASLYGMQSPSNPGEFAEASVDPNERAGLLTQAAFLTLSSAFETTSPIHRGVYVREHILCQPLPPPPNNVAAAPEVAPDVSERERLDLHRNDPVCASCHSLIDPIGLSFEQYDAIGRWRDQDVDGAPVNASGSLDAVGDDVDGPVDGAVDMSSKLADSEQVRECVATQWFRNAFGRTETEADACTLFELQERFAASNYRLRDLLIAITQLDAFRYRTTVDAVGECQ